MSVKKDLITLLRVAMSLEALTIPPYMTAYWSIKKSPKTEANKKAKDIIHSVAMEEMLHMMSVGNIIASLGYCPLFYHHSNTFNDWKEEVLPILKFQVDLAPFSIQQVEKFLQIEKPVKPIDIKTSKYNKDFFSIKASVENKEVVDNSVFTLEGRVNSTSLIEDKLNFIKTVNDFKPNAPLVLSSEILRKEVDDCKTIGKFYSILISELNKLKDEDFRMKEFSQLDLSHDPRVGTIEQITIPSFIVDSKEKAVKLLEWVVDQGEGNKGHDDNPQDEDGELAHYYRFLQIKKNMEIVKNEKTGVFEFDPSKTFQVDEKYVLKFGANDHSGSDDLQKNFNSSYFTMFKELQSFYLTGERSYIMQSFDYMMKMSTNAEIMMEKGTCPSFKFEN